MNKNIQKNYIDYNEIKKDIAKYEKQAIEIIGKNKELYIVTKGGLYAKGCEVINIFDNVEKLLEYLDRKSYKTSTNHYWLFDYLGFLKDFCKETNKYRTFDKKRIWKLQKTQEMGNKSEKIEIEIIKRDPIVQTFLREKKFKRILQ